MTIKGGYGKLRLLPLLPHLQTIFVARLPFDITMPHQYTCAYCLKSFATSKARSCHITNCVECFQAYVEFLERTVDLPTPSLDFGNVEMAQDSNDFEYMETDSIADIAPEDPDATLNDSNGDYGIAAGYRTPDLDSEGEYSENFPQAGEIKFSQDPPFKILRDVQGEGDLRFFPFQSEEDWELAAWLHRSGLPTSQINAFFRLKYVSAVYQRHYQTIANPLCKVKSHPVCFRNARSLQAYISEIIYTGPRWTAQTIVPDQGAPSGKVQLFYQNPLEAIKYLLGRPTFAGHLDFTPRRHWSSEDTGAAERFYLEMSTGNWWWETQVNTYTLGSGFSLNTRRPHSLQVLP